VGVGPVNIPQHYTVTKDEKKYFRTIAYDELERLAPRLGHSINRRKFIMLLLSNQEYFIS
jgi:hypothetical protein